MAHSISGISVRKYVVAKNANSTRPASVSAMAVATAMLRAANSVANVNRSDGDAPLAAPIKPADKKRCGHEGRCQRHGVPQAVHEQSRVARHDQQDQHRDAAKA